MLRTMQEENEQKQSWRIVVRAKAKSFDFKLKATKDSPNWKLSRIYVLLKIHKLFFFLVNSESGPSNSSKSERTLKSKFPGIAKKVRSIIVKNPQNSPKAGAKKYLDQLQLCAKEVPINCFGYLIAAIVLGFALQKGTFFKYGLVILLCLACLLMKRCEAVKNVKFFVISIATVLACCFVLSDLNSYYQLKYVESYGSKWVCYWRIWKVVGPKILDTLPKAISFSFY